MGAYILRPKFFLFCTYSGIKGWLVGRLVNKASKKTNGKVLCNDLRTCMCALQELQLNVYPT